MKIGVLTIGAELLNGARIDTNSNWISKTVIDHGGMVEFNISTKDNQSSIIKALDFLLDQSIDMIIMTGGLGPTHDDITTESIANAFKKKLKKDDNAIRLLKNHYKNSNIEFNEARQKMAIIPEGAELIDNPVSVAPGFKIKNVFVFAGVPKIMQGMFHSIKNQLTGGIFIKSKTITCNVGEGLLASDLKILENDFTDVKIGSYPYFNPSGFGTSIVIRSENVEKIDTIIQKLIIIINKLDGTFKLID